LASCLYQPARCYSTAIGGVVSLVSENVAPSTDIGEAVSDGIFAICNTSAVVRVCAPLELLLELLELLEVPPELLELLELLEVPPELLELLELPVGIGVEWLCPHAVRKTAAVAAAPNSTS
jgi:hypothetical protein